MSIRQWQAQAGARHLQQVEQRAFDQFIGKANPDAVGFGPLHRSENDLSFKPDLALASCGQGAATDLRTSFAKIDDRPLQAVEHGCDDNADIDPNALTATWYLHGARNPLSGGYQR